MATRPESMMIQGGPREYKQRAIVEARNAQDTISKVAPRDPNAGKYQFKELIGKGSYGRVYKSLEKATGRTVAIKVLTPDDADASIPAEARDTNLTDALKEIHILERLRQSGATNVNQFIEAFTVHSQLWLVSDYCSGGSLSTLKRAAGGKLEERYIRAVSRELATGLASVHKAGIVHRDVKCANVMISESGGVQIIDFGVSAVLMSNMEEDKRKTIIGTPHWMAPELQQAPDKEVPHGSEVDVWAFGITLYECAMGYPPNATVTQQARLRHLLRNQPPRLPDDKFSPDLRDLVKYVLNPDAKARPTMQDICKHPYLQGSEKEYPTSSLKNLVETYYNWERSGGHRASLWYAGGAAQAKFDKKAEQDEWVFSTTAAFDKMHDDTDTDAFDLSSSPPREPDDDVEDPSITRTVRAEAYGGQSRKQQDAEARRGEKHLEGLFDQSANPYKFGAKAASDLPLRSGDSASSLHSKELSVSSNDDGTPSINLEAIDNKKKRATMAWKWNENMPKLGDAPLPKRPSVQAQDQYSLGEPVTARPTNPRDTLDLDALLSGGGSRESVRKTLDMDAMFQALPKATRDSIRKTLDMDAMMNGGVVSRDSIRKTLDLDALLAGVTPQASQPPIPPVPAVPQNIPTHSQQSSFESHRRRFDSNAYDNNAAPMPRSHQASDSFSFDPPPESEQTMRPASQAPNQGQQQSFQGHDFATGAKNFSLGDPVQRPRPPTFDFESLMSASNSDLDAMMAGEHDYQPGARGPMTDDDRSSLASHDLSSINMSGMHSRNQSGSVGGLASSPPTSPFAQAFPDHHSQHLPGIGLLPVPDYPAHVDPSALRDGVDKAIPAAEMKRLLAHFGGVLDVALSYLDEAERRAGGPPVHSSNGAADDADTESIHESINGDDAREREGTPGEEDGLEMPHR